MNMEQAKAISLSLILDIIGCKAVKKKGNDIWYHSPFREDKTASFHIHTGKNIWYDFGEAKGGNAIDFVCLYLERQNEDYTPADALRWLTNMRPVGSPCLASIESGTDYKTTLSLRRVSSLQNTSLISYLKSRGISAALAKKYLKEVHIYNTDTGKNFFALGLLNEGEGYELRNNLFKGCVAPKNITFIRGTQSMPKEIHVFEGFMDFLSALAEKNTDRFEGDTIILNSVSCLKHAFTYIANYTYRTVYSWLDNDAAGINAAQGLKEFVLSQGNLALRQMNRVYAKHKDVNAWHMQKLGLSLK